MGLVSAYQLAGAGALVSLIDTQVAGSEASWAGGGIVSPLYPWRYSPAVTALVQWSQGYYPQLGGQLLAATGIDSEVCTTGLYWLDLKDGVSALNWAQREGWDLASVPMASVRAAVPALGPDFSRALYMPSVANVRNPRLLKALREAVLQVPSVTIREHCAVTGFIRKGGRICGVMTGQGEMHADHVVLAAGAWSGELLKTLGIQLPVQPVKGQMILYKCETGFLPSMVLAGGRYAIPRKDGHVLVGSTLERVGFDKTTTSEALTSLQASAESLLPALAEAELVGHWAGLRPSSPEGIPFIGELPEHPGLWLNCGHYRNGLVLAPASCELLKNLMLGETPIVDPRPYAPAGRL